MADRFLSKGERVDGADGERYEMLDCDPGQLAALDKMPEQEAYPLIRYKVRRLRDGAVIDNFPSYMLKAR